MVSQLEKELKEEKMGSLLSWQQCRTQTQGLEVLVQAQLNEHCKKGYGIFADKLSQLV